MQRCCRQRRRATQLQGGSAAAADDDVESDSDHNDLSSQHSDASVHLYMPVDRDSIDSVSDDAWQNVMLEPAPHVDATPYVQLQYVPRQQATRSHHRWQVFNDSLDDDSDVDDPLVDFSHQFSVPSQLATSAAAVEPSTSACTVHYSRLEKVELDVDGRRNNDSNVGAPVAAGASKV